MTGKPVEIMTTVYNVLKYEDFDCDINIIISDTKWKIKAHFTEGNSNNVESWEMSMTLNELVEDEKYEVSVHRTGGSFITFNDTYNKFIQSLKE